MSLAGDIRKDDSRLNQDRRLPRIMYSGQTSRSQEMTSYLGGESRKSLSWLGLHIGGGINARFQEGLGEDEP